MSSPTASLSASPAAPAPALPVGRALGIGLAGIAATLVGLLISPARVVATAWLLGLVFWTAVTIGMLMLVLIHHIFDAMWSTVLRRQMEHFLSAFKWLALLFVPIFAASWLWQRDLVWPWLDPHHFMAMEGKTVGADVIYAKKHAFLNFPALVIWTFVFFGIWIWISARLRRASFRQDADGDPRWRSRNGFTAGFGIPVMGLSLTAAAIYWIKSLEYHWFSTIFGVWYFADCMRGAYAVCVLIMLWLWNRGDYKGIVHEDHWHSIGQMMLTFTVFWGYIAFAQYFLIWNADVPEETFFYNIREYGDWWWIGMFLVFGYFLLPFLALLSYRYKVTHRTIRRIALWILMGDFIDLCWNTLPVLKDVHGHPLPFFSLTLVWSLTATAGIGGICIWSYLRSFSTTKILPIHDPRIEECLLHHE